MDSEDIVMSKQPITLNVVYKDELTLNHLKKLLETKLDNNDTKPSPFTFHDIVVVAWGEKAYEEHKKNGSSRELVLYLGDVKGIESLMPILDVKYNEYGIIYGWSGTQALLYADPAAMDNKRLYNEFLDKLNAYPVPDSLKSEKVHISDDEIITEAVNESEHRHNPFAKLGKFFTRIGNGIGSLFSPARRKIPKQQYYYGIYTFYQNHLNEFVKQ